jgi:[ribosomal protein S5]-alanine N-acetyltransferase
MSQHPYIFRTERLGFRRYTAADNDAVRAIFADPQARQFYPAMQNQDAVDRWVSWNLRNYEEFGFGLWALELLDQGEFIGDAGITYQTVEGQRILEIGWHIHSDYRSQGYATEAGRACLKYGFDVLSASSLSSIVDPKNAPSIKVAARVHENKREYQAKNGVMWLYYSLSPLERSEVNRIV